MLAHKHDGTISWEFLERHPGKILINHELLKQPLWFIFLGLLGLYFGFQILFEFDFSFEFFLFTIFRFQVFVSKYFCFKF